VDVYSAWIDACEEVNRQKRLQALKTKERASRDDSRSPPPTSYSSRDRLNPYDQEDDEDDEDDDY
jgi:transcription elongation factor Elf1